MLWLAAGDFGDDGEKAREQVRTSLSQTWRLGIEPNGGPTFETLYTQWCDDGA